MRFKSEAPFEQDLVLIYIENKPAFYARVEKIAADVKPKWWRVKFLALTLPLKMMTWIVDDEQIRGADFTMAGIPIRIEKVVPPEEIEEPPENVENARSKKEGEEMMPRKARVVSLHNKKKRQ